MAWDEEEDDALPGALSLLYERQVPRQIDDWWHQAREELAAVLSEMAAGGYVEPSDDELAEAVHERV